MRGKLGLIVGLTAGYVLGTRAGRERYEQISRAASKVWHTAPVQKQVDKVKNLAKSSALAVPGALWAGIVKISQAASTQKSPGAKLDAAIAETKQVVADEVEAVEKPKKA